MKLKTLVVGPIETNCYILSDEASHEAIIIDPGADSNAIRDYLKRNHLKPKFIVNTHGHIDHIGVDAQFNLPVYIHKSDRDYLDNDDKNLSNFLGIKGSAPIEIKTLEDHDTVAIANIKLEVIHTPGHTPGGISLRVDNMVFTGDALFCSGIGRTDLPGASESQLIESIKNRLLVLPDDTVIFPGHGPSSTIGQEKKSNPLL
ncbi:MAG: MBL fold metallo-hydrolase [Candidatus Omnitrophota bacterium]